MILQFDDFTLVHGNTQGVKENQIKVLMLNNSDFNFISNLEYLFTSLVLCNDPWFQLYQFQYMWFSSSKSFFFLGVRLNSPHGRKEKNKESEGI